MTNIGDARPGDAFRAANGVIWVLTADDDEWPWRKIGQNTEGYEDNVTAYEANLTPLVPADTAMPEHGTVAALRWAADEIETLGADDEEAWTAVGIRSRANYIEFNEALAAERDRADRELAGRVIAERFPDADRELAERMARDHFGNLDSPGALVAVEVAVAVLATIRAVQELTK